VFSGLDGPRIFGSGKRDAAERYRNVMNTLLDQTLLAGMFHAEDLLLPDFAPLPNRELQCTPTSVETSLNVANPFISGFAAKFEVG
jgi:hypothetical protein